jgi:hypothetical protein
LKCDSQAVSNSLGIFRKRHELTISEKREGFKEE